MGKRPYKSTKTRAGSLMHSRVREWVERQITTGRFLVGERVPTELQIMEMHQVSRGTVRRAMSELEFKGYVRRWPGRGTFVLSSEPGSGRPMSWAVLRRYPYDHEDSYLDGLRAIGRDADASLHVEYVGDSHEKLIDAMTRMIEQKVDGFIVEPLPYDTRIAEACEIPLKKHKPLVLVRAPVRGVDAPVVVFNHEAIGRQAARHLLDLGHRRIGYVSSPRYWVVDEHIKGCTACLADAGIELRKSWLSFEDRVSDQQGFTATQRLLAQSPRPTAIIALNDVTAGNAYRAIRSAGLRIPHDISVIAATGTGPHLANALDPPLTVWCPWTSAYTLGRTAGEVLRSMVKKRWPATVKQVLVEAAPLPRGSVAMAMED